MEGIDGSDGSPSGEVRALRDRVAALEEERARPPRHRGRSFLAAVLIALGCLLAPLSVVAVWASDQVADTDRYVAAVAPLASDPAVQDAVADRVTDALMTRIDLSTLLSGVAPGDRPRLEKALGRAGGALQDALRGFVHDRAREVAASDDFERLWTEANRRAHSTVDKALTGKGGGAVELTDDAAVLDLGPVVDKVEQRLVNRGLTAAGHLPEVHTHITLVRSEAIGEARTYLRVLQFLGNWLPVIAVLLIAGGVLLAVRRRRALVAGALGAAFAAGVLGIGLRVFRAVYLDALPAGVSPGAAGAVYDAMTRFLGTTVRMVVAVGVVVALSAWLTGPGRRARTVRGLWTSGIGAARATAEGAGLRTGPVGPFVRRFRAWITWLLVAGALLVWLLWAHPTGWVVVGIALCLLFLLAVVEFLAAGAPAPDRERAAASG
ncbi:MULTISPECIES: hypothetical protein [unclassified Streptomyces]|uniref:hypothetical protein n=1 Tax=unclassified Streptomyces TaxID=2593676 RepID=UPI000DAEC1AB|nr:MULTISPECIES: hypothetical protein [unclassified Streptomyces]PZT77649.1 hypothetical protein DNK56_31330 [Streptomyces sp. AC1-42W]PZT78397.1 hypothetical protein DNK55_01355 [Streptomyces sp. AC1-42T]